MKTLPDEIVSSAFAVSEAEFGWRKPDIFAALNAIAATGRAILSGDVWIIAEGKIQNPFPETKGLRVWNLEPIKADEAWSDYCQRTCVESISEIEKFQLESEVDAASQECIYYHPSFIDRNDVKALIPLHIHDHERAEAAIEAGYPTVALILPELLEWLQDMNWPVAQELAPFLSSVGTPLIPHIRRIFEGDDEIWKYWIITYILSESREVAAAFRAELTRMADAPTESEIEEGLDESARSVLKEFGWLAE